jgi:glycosyltransferase involved in cell wall biosynthesis
MTRAATALDTPVALSSLQPRLETGWPPGVRWSTDSGVGPDSLDIPIGHTTRFCLRSFADARLRSHLSLRTPGHDRSAGFAKAQVLLRGEPGSVRLWSGLIGFGIPRAVKATLPAWSGEAELSLFVSAVSRRGGASPAHTVRWSQPVLEPAPIAASDRPADLDGSAGATERPAPPASDGPLVSILTPVHNPTPPILEEMLTSVRAQSFDDWELVLVDDASTDPDVIDILDRAAAEDPRIRLERRSEGGGISAATNTGLSSATGTYIALLDHDDVLDPEALAHVAAKIAEDPDIDMLYSDEDIFDGHRRLALFRKPSWSPDLLRSHMYSCHFGVYRRSLAEEIGGFRSEFDGSQDHDFVLRLSERTDRERIVHIPRVLYHWRSHAESAADNPIAKPQAAIAGRRAIADQLERHGIEATANFSALRSWYRVDYPPAKTGSTAVVLPIEGLGQGGLDQLAAAAGTWLRGTGGEVEVIVAGEASRLKLVAPALEEALGDRLEAVTTDGDVGHAAAANRAIDATTAERLVLLDGPVEALTSNWIGRLSSFAEQDGVGLVGAKILAADGRVESAGLALRDGLPAPVGFGSGPTEFGPLALLQVCGNFCAVAGAAAITHADFEDLGGLDENLAELAVVDLSLRAWNRGQRIVGAPDAILRRLPGQPGPVNDLAALQRFRARWGETLPTDPYFNPVLAAILTGRTVP